MKDSAALRKIGIFGSTGTIGTQTLDLVRRHPHLFRIEFLSAFQQAKKLQSQVDEFNVPAVWHPTQTIVENPHCFVGQASLEELLKKHTVDVVIMGISGFEALHPTYATLAHSQAWLGMANKEVIVTAWPTFESLLTHEQLKKVIPIDSEHNSLFQLLRSQEAKDIKSITLTASGGPFFQNPRDLKTVTCEEALAHPKWKMGQKISIDSATMMNKALEVIEAHHLFGFEETQIQVLTHPQSLVHGMIELTDNSTLLHACETDMRGPIGFALTYPERFYQPIETLNWKQLRDLQFYEPDKRFPSLMLAREIIRSESQAQKIIFNTANELAVDLFLKKQISFTDIFTLIEKGLSQVSESHHSYSDLNSIIHLHNETKTILQKNINIRKNI